MKICSRPDCDRQARTRHMCDLHYKRWVARGGLKTLCAEPGCRRYATVGKICGMHSTRQRRARLKAQASQ